MWAQGRAPSPPPRGSLNVCAASGQRGHCPGASSPRSQLPAPCPLQTLQKKVSVVSVAEVMFDTSVFAQLPGQEALLRAQVGLCGAQPVVRPLVLSPCACGAHGLGGGVKAPAGTEGPDP